MAARVKSRVQVQVATNCPTRKLCILFIPVSYPTNTRFLSFSRYRARPDPCSCLFLFFSLSSSWPDVSDPKINEAYEEVRSNKSDINWVLIDYEVRLSTRSDKLVVTATGSGGLAELQEKLDPAKASYAYARVTYSNDKESQREKFILVTWIGSGCKVMRKAKVSLRCLLMSVFRVYSIDVPAKEKDDLKEDPIVVTVAKGLCSELVPYFSQELTAYPGWGCQLRWGVTP
ncbi:hypothetical protein EDB87DRAFT_1560811 [Lactarius vividus]|nr:hypothetical protein EDB87DRAFT_1560811 [Lactarius vividus]